MLAETALVVWVFHLSNVRRRNIIIYTKRLVDGGCDVSLSRDSSSFHLLFCFQRTKCIRERNSSRCPIDLVQHRLYISTRSNRCQASDVANFLAHHFLSRPPHKNSRDRIRCHVGANISTHLVASKGAPNGHLVTCQQKPKQNPYPSNWLDQKLAHFCIRWFETNSFFLHTRWIADIIR